MKTMSEPSAEYYSKIFITLHGNPSVPVAAAATLYVTVQHTTEMW